MGSLIEDEAVLVSDVRDADARSGPTPQPSPAPGDPGAHGADHGHPGHVDRPERGPVHELIGVPDQP
jgi:hypothetical protein